MPGIGGAEATRQIMRRRPCPILVVTANVAGNYSLVCEALSNGAFDAVATPALGDNPPSQAGAALLAKLAHVEQDPFTAREPGRVVNLWAHWAGQATWPAPRPTCRWSLSGRPREDQAPCTILSKWPEDFPAAVLVVQHISADFAASLAGWLSEACKLKVCRGAGGERPQAGTIFVAATEDHLVMRPGGTLAYTREPIGNPFRPSVDVLFQSLAHHAGPSIAVLLTGIGRDGAEGLLGLRRAGWHTIAQDRAHQHRLRHAPGGQRTRRCGRSTPS